MKEKDRIKDRLEKWDNDICPQCGGYIWKKLSKFSKYCRVCNIDWINPKEEK